MITPSLWPLKWLVVKVERGGIYARRLAKWLYKLLQLVPKGGGGEWVAQNANVANAYHTKSVAV